MEARRGSGKLLGVFISSHILAKTVGQWLFQPIRFFLQDQLIEKDIHELNQVLKILYP